MRTFTEIKKDLKEKWLDYWEINRKWILIFCTQYDSAKRWIPTPDKGHRPIATIILGIICGLEPDFATNFMETLVSLNQNENTLIQSLGLNSDPDIELEKRREEREKAEQEANLPPPSLLDDFRKPIE
ncbi:MAG: DUF5331 domain-containing protein [Cyanobacteria bacterium]|nr:DUF5331 domain-containing protein [Cyanobacteria bacterium CG_2015-16_32_12]NCO78783.1 DUF5331 domain-containing protein [Cyanobacteria bacterium CG_2015-22_32_23]NCQ05778.1 DUF5331 domain-containing protein [Cyanobacteria bacterium CG_2015-09_32_10]NCQ42097.1 DUF5331 domain-containing protein [Cyanobacteria bacterium CG_2015-04_32_10]NCS86090.1 DUF5331 domain-containing protein [Cyanobacteria bacterium CG_2015-02_32_10]